MMPPRPPMTVTRLSDHFGQYVLIQKFACGHSRMANPRTLARLAGWDATLKIAVSRLRCSQCGKRACSASGRLRPSAIAEQIVVRIDFAEWTGGGKLRYTSFFALREDKDPKKVVRVES